MNKKNKVNRLFFFVWGLFLLIGVNAGAQFTETREFVKRFAIKPETRIDITNKYGRIELNTWEKDSVVIKFRIEINEKKPVKLEKIKENLDFDISNSPYYLVVQTQLDKNKSQFETEFQKFKETILQTNGSIRIDLTVFLPDNHELRLENKFGDIIMGDYKGETQISISNGKLKTGDLNKRSTLNLNFADAAFNSLPNARITSNYSDIQVKNSGVLRLESKSSTVEIMNSEDLSIDSRRDKLRIRLADKVEGEGSFTQFRISEMKNKANIRLSYGSLDVEKIISSFSSIYVESRSADVNLYFQADSKFNFEITETKTDLKLGRELKVENKEILDSKENKNRHTGYFGKKMKEEHVIVNSVGGEVNILSY